MTWLLFALLAMFFGSLREITQKRALQGEHTMEFLVVRSFFMLILSFLLLPFVDLNVSWRAAGLIAIVAILACIAMVYRNKSLKHMEISELQPLMNLSPVFVLIIAFIFLGEKLSVVQLGGFFLIVAGTYILEIDHEHHGILSPIKKIFKSKYHLMVIFAGFLFAITNTLDRFILTDHTDPFTYLFIVWNMINIIFISYHALKYNFRGIKMVLKVQGKKIFWPALFSLFMVLFFYKALEIAYASIVVVIFRMQSIITTIEGGKFFHEEHLLKKSIACGIMTAGAILVIL